MTTSSEPGATTTGPPPDTATAAPDRRTLPWWGFGIANVAVSFALAVAAWWLLVDPEWSVTGSYPQPFTALLFWTIIAVVWVAFSCGWTGPTRMRQPARGLVGIAVTLLIGVGITLLLGYGWGRIDPSFAADRPGGAGFTTGNLIVLFAFFFSVTAVVNWGQWPWATRLAQPWRGLAEVAGLAVPTLVVYGVLALPNLAVWADPATALISTNTLIGWFYCLVVSVVLTGLLTENLPWRLAGAPARVAGVSVVGNLVLGSVLYVVLKGLATVLTGPADAAALGPAVHAHAAELGVCWVFWMIAWANVFGNRPTRRGTIVNIAARIGVTLLLAMGTYLLYYRALAGPVLHEPVAAGSLRGDALGFVDWLVLWMLWYVLFLGSLGLPRPRDESTMS